MKPGDLHGEALAAYATWRQMGLTESQAIEEVERSGVVDYTARVETYRNSGMSEDAAKFAAAGRGGAPRSADPFDALVESYKRRGMSDDAARFAAIGRGGSEREVRAEMWESAAIGRRADQLRESGKSHADAFRQAEAEHRKRADGRTPAAPPASVRELIERNRGWR